MSKIWDVHGDLDGKTYSCLFHLSGPGYIYGTEAQAQAALATLQPGKWSNLRLVEVVPPQPAKEPEFFGEKADEWEQVRS